MRILCLAFLTLLGVNAFGQWLGTNPIYFNAGNVGIGTTNPGVWFGSKTFEFSDTRPVFKLSSTSSTGLSTIVFTNSSVNSTSHSGEFHLNYQYNSTNSDKSNVTFYGYPGGPALTIEAAGNIGIGTTNPSSALHIERSSGGWLQNIRGQAIQQGEFIGVKITSGYLNETNKWAGVAAVAVDQHSNNTALSLYASASEKVRIDGTTGNVGIGTTAPTEKLHISGDNASAQIGIRVENTTASVTGFAPIQFKTGTSSNVWQTFARNGDLFLGIANVADYMVIKYGGSVGIGTTTPTQKLTVNGTIYGKEVKVDLSVPGPDYVFANNYQLLTLNELKTYIDQHKHLPEVPSAEEMEKDGIQLGEMNMLLLKKIEELTLYVIEQNKRISELEKNK